MLKSEKQIFIFQIDEVIKSRSSKISKRDLERLVTVREGLKKTNSKSKIFKLLEIVKELFDPDE